MKFSGVTFPRAASVGLCSVVRVTLAAGCISLLGACSLFSSAKPWHGTDAELKKTVDPGAIPVEQMYNNGVDALNAKNYKLAATQFDLVQQTYPYSSWAVNAELMQGYAQYLQSNYTDAIGSLDRFIQLHPAHRDIAYAYYLRALCYYEQIADITRDQKNTQLAMAALQEVVNRFPDSAYARDAQLKIDLGRDHLAGKEMEIGRWYENQHLYTAAIGRFQRVVDDFQTTNHVPEALERLTEIYLILGLPDQARRAAAVLGHNYPGSQWYADSYAELARVGEVSNAPLQEPQRPGFFDRAWHAQFSDHRQRAGPRRMLTTLSIRDVVLIERLDLSFGAGLTVLTGETGAGKSILLDSLGLAMGARADAGMIRAGAEQASVTAAFAPLADHPAFELLTPQGIVAEDEIVLRRVIGKDGRSRAFINDQPVTAALLRRTGALLIEIQGQHDQMGLADPANHAGLLDAYGVPPALRQDTTSRYRAWRDAVAALAAARLAIAEAERDQEWLRHTTDELAKLAPEDGEEDRLAAERQRLQQGEKRAEAIAAALSELASRDRRSPGPAAALRAASRALQRLAPSNDPDAPNPAAPAMAALERAEEALAEAESLLTRLADDAEADPRLLEAAEERLFALRAVARKHNVAVSELPALLATLRGRLAALETGAMRVDELHRAEISTRAAYVAACTQLSEARRAASAKLDRAIARELPPLRLERARFVTDIAPLAESDWGPNGADAVRFLIATNPGQEPGMLAKIASGGELSRLMLALKVVLAGGSPVPSLVFDEVDSGIGGATAAAVGERLARVAHGVQVLLVTHSPQVAARGAAHLRVSKLTAKGRAETRVERLDGTARREEIARMLAGETVTEAARAAADSLLGVA